MLLIEVNLLAVLAGSLTYLVIAIAWYSSYLYGPQWTKSLHLEAQNLIDLLSPKSIFYSLILSLITSYTLAVLIKTTGMDSAVSGLIVGFLVSVGLIFSTNSFLQLHQKNLPEVYKINSIFSILATSLMGLVIGILI